MLSYWLIDPMVAMYLDYKKAGYSTSSKQINTQKL